MDRELNVDGMKLFKKLICPAVSSRSTDGLTAGKWLSSVLLPTSTKLIVYSVKKINHRNSSQWKIA